MPEMPDATDAARRLADEHDVALSGIDGTGAEGRILKGDVEDAIAARPDRINEPLAPTTMASKDTSTITATRNIPLAMIGRLEPDDAVQAEILGDPKTKRGGRVEAGTAVTVSPDCAKALQEVGYAE